jgi:hypothetical protein
MTILHRRTIPGLQSAVAYPRRLSAEDMKDAAGIHRDHLQIYTAAVL